MDTFKPTTNAIRLMIADFVNKKCDAVAFRANLLSLNKTGYLEKLLDFDPNEWEKEFNAMEEMLLVLRMAKEKGRNEQKDH